MLIRSQTILLATAIAVLLGGMIVLGLLVNQSDTILKPVRDPIKPRQNIHFEVKVPIAPISLEDFRETSKFRSVVGISTKLILHNPA